MKKYLLRLLLVFSSLVACAQSKGDIAWRLVKMREGQNLMDVRDRGSDFTIFFKKKSFKGHVGCSHFNGKLEYTERGSSFPILFISTNLECPDYTGEFEYAIIQALGICDKLVFKENQAEFYNQARIVLVLEKR